MGELTRCHTARKLLDKFALAAPVAQVTEHDDKHCGDAIPGNDSPRIAGLNVADDPMPGKYDPQHDQGGNNQASFVK